MNQGDFYNSISLLSNVSCVNCGRLTAPYNFPPAMRGGIKGGAVVGFE